MTTEEKGSLQSNTYLVGEKRLNRDRYSSWEGGGDAQSMYIGCDPDSIRFAGPNFPLRQDRPGVADTWAFGGPHVAGCQFVMCDGSVQFITDQIDSHKGTCTRINGNPYNSYAPLREEEIQAGSITQMWGVYQLLAFRDDGWPIPKDAF